MRTIPRSTNQFLRPLHRLARSCEWVRIGHAGAFLTDGELFEIPKVVFHGPELDRDDLHIGVFASLHGDEPEGALAIATVLHRLAANPDAAHGLVLSFYPICNPSGFEAATAHSLSGADFDQEFWTFSTEPEVRLLERELKTSCFDGLITLRSDSHSTGAYGSARDQGLGSLLLEYGLIAAGRTLPVLRTEPISDISKFDENVLSAPPEQPAAFDVTVVSPRAFDEHLQAFALASAVDAILTGYRNHYPASGDAARRMRRELLHRRQHEVGSFAWT